jgi:Holliday junction DNA helicase RuvA
MIATLTGKVESVGGTSCILEVNGVGYLIFMPLSALEVLSHATEPVKVFTHFQVREDDASLYGFLTAADKTIFEKIIGVSGIGPKTALAILGTLSGERFREAIENEDHRSLTGVSGVGLKTAQRLILELKGKLSKGVLAESAGFKSHIGFHSSVSDAIDALIALGYPAKEAATVIETIVSAEQNLTTPEIVRKALKNLGRK